ncbi:hypothetical protein L596_024944 [Steinernema carpocapsae]|uniref:Uncharacterized protein n=1 Tax=Steinernema carpocapsae TaxID=34508 RepID=A0A4U5M6B7_STECR|nr:hypothetical protein L596_024944 [Steinernema carpocapsae]
MEPEEHLEPIAEGCERRWGVVITPQMLGTFVGAVFCPETKRVFLMPRKLFEAPKIPTAMSRSRELRLQKIYIFGDVLTFDSNEAGVVKQIVGRQPPIWEPLSTETGKLTLKMSVVRSPKGDLFNETFGQIGLNTDDNELPHSSVPVFTRVSCIYTLEHPFQVRFQLESFLGVDQESMHMARNAPWSTVLPLLIDPSAPDYESDDGNKDTKTKDTKGVLLFNFIYSSEYPNREFLRVFVHSPEKFGPDGRLGAESILKPGFLVRFNAFHSDIHDKWFVADYDARRHRIPKVQIPGTELNPNKPQQAFTPIVQDDESFMIAAKVPKLYAMGDIPGLYHNTHLGLVIERRGLITALYSKPAMADILFTGFAPRRISNFEVVGFSGEAKPTQFLKYIEACGYIVGSEILCPQHPTVLFSIPFAHNRSAGTAVTFHAQRSLSVGPGNDIRISYKVYDLRALAKPKFSVATTMANGKEAIMAIVYRVKIHQLEPWVSPLVGVVDDPLHLLKDAPKEGALVILDRDADYSRSYTLFYIVRYIGPPREAQQSYLAARKIVAVLNEN